MLSHSPNYGTLRLANDDDHDDHDDDGDDDDDDDQLLPYSFLFSRCLFSLPLRFF